MPPVRLFKTSVWMRGYSPGENAWKADGHYTVASSGSIHEVREGLREIAFKHFQNAIRRFYGMRISSGEIKGKTELEQPAFSPSDTVHVEIYETIYHGRQHYERLLASEDIPFRTYDPQRDENEIDEAYADDEYEEDADDEDYDEDDEEDDDFELDE
jgi:hypothetical protein